MSSPPPAKRPKNYKANCALTNYEFKGPNDCLFSETSNEKSLKCKIYGTPRPQYRVHGKKNGEPSVQVYNVSSPNKKKLQSSLKSVMALAPVSPFFVVNSDKPVKISIKFYLKRPKDHYLVDSISGKMILSPNAPKYVTKTPDLDNLVKLVLDSLEGIVYDNDKVVSEMICTKQWLYSQPDTLWDPNSEKHECMLLKITQLYKNV